MKPPQVVMGLLRCLVLQVLLDLKTPSSDDFDIRIITTGTGGIINSGSGEVTIQRQGATKLATTSTGIDVTGVAVVDSLTSSGQLELQASTPSIHF